LISQKAVFTLLLVMQPLPSPLSTPPPPPLRSHWQRVALPVQLLAIILSIMLLGSVMRCEHKQPTGNAKPQASSESESAAEGAEESRGLD